MRFFDVRYDYIYSMAKTLILTLCPGSRQPWFTFQEGQLQQLHENLHPVTGTYWSHMMKNLPDICPHYRLLLYSTYWRCKGAPYLARGPDVRGNSCYWWVR